MLMVSVDGAEAAHSGCEVVPDLDLVPSLAQVIYDAGVDAADVKPY